MVVLEGSGGSPSVVRGTQRHAREPVARHAPRDRGAERVEPLHQDGVHVGLDRVEVGRHEDPRPVRPLLVDVHRDLRVPDTVETVHDELRLDLRERIPVAVVVVTRVAMVELGRAAAFRRRAEGLRVPPADDVDAVGVQRRHQDEDGAVECGADLRAGAACEPIRDLQRREEPADFRRVHARGDEHDGARLRDEERGRRRVRREPRVREAPLHLAQRRELAEVGRARDEDGEEWKSVRGPAELPDAHPVARSVERAKIVDDGSPLDESPLRPGREAQDRGRRGQWPALSGKRRRSGDDQCEGEAERVAHPGLSRASGQTSSPIPRLRDGARRGSYVTSAAPTRAA